MEHVWTWIGLCNWVIRPNAKSVHSLKDDEAIDRLKSIKSSKILFFIVWAGCEDNNQSHQKFMWERILKKQRLRKEKCEDESFKSFGSGWRRVKGIWWCFYLYSFIFHSISLPLIVFFIKSIELMDTMKKRCFCNVLVKFFRFWRSE